MIVGGYTLHLYCDFAGVHEYRDAFGFAEFSGDNQRKAEGDARRRGWRFHIVDGQRLVKCPKCVKAGIKTVKTQEPIDE